MIIPEMLNVRVDNRLRFQAGDVPEWLQKHKRRPYIYAAILSFPYWVSRAELKRIDAEAERLSSMTGIPHEVDHIVPISHPRVCGLTVPWNLQILTQHANGSKGGAWSENEPDVEQFEMFPRNPVEQYALAL